MAALTRGRAILQDNRTLILGNSFAIRTNQTSSLKKPHNPISSALDLASQPKTLTTVTNKILYAPTTTNSTRILSAPSFALSLHQRSFSDDQKVVHPENVDISKIVISPPTKTNTAKIAKILYNDKRILRIQTPVMRVPFGLVKAPTEQDKPGSAFNLQLSFDKREANPELSGFYDLLKSIEQKTIEEAHKNAVAWFGKEVPLDVVKYNFKSSIRESPPNTTFAPTFRTKVPVFTDQVSNKSGARLSVFNKDRVKVENYDLKGARVVAIIELKHAWVAGGSSLGLTYNTLQVKIVEEGTPSPKTNIAMGEYSFVDGKQ